MTDLYYQPAHFDQQAYTMLIQTIQIAHLLSEFANLWTEQDKSNKLHASEVSMEMHERFRNNGFNKVQ